MDLSFQLYSSRSVPSQAEFIKKLSGLGYTQVEGFGGVYDDIANLKDTMDSVNISMSSGHFGLAELEQDFDACLSTANALEMKNIYVPYLEEKDRPVESAGYIAIAKRLMALNGKVRDAGFEFGWHNHDFELVPLKDGSIPLDILLNEAPALSWEADLAWVKVGGADPLVWVEKYGSRISSVHIKDTAAEGENIDEDGWADVGHGTIDWKELNAVVRKNTSNPLMIMEHDKPADPFRFASNSIDSFRSWH